MVASTVATTMATEHYPTQEARIIIQELLDTVEENEWIIHDFDATTDPYEPIQLEVSITYNGEVGVDE